ANRLYRRALPSHWKQRERPGRKGCRGGSKTRSLVGQRRENAQAEDQERREKALQAHGDRQDQARGRWQAPPADQPQRQVHPPEPRHRDSGRRRYGAREALGALRPQVRSSGTWHASSAARPLAPSTKEFWSRRR